MFMLLAACGADRDIRRGDKAMALGEYYDAANAYRQAYRKIPAKERAKRGDVSLKMARCYDRGLQTAKAVAAYRNALRYGHDNAEVRMALARQLMKTGSYTEAARLFQAVADSLPDDRQARTALDAAVTAPQVKEAGSRYAVKRMDVFNSRRADYSPMLYGDDYDRLYFTSTRNEALGDEISGITGAKAGDIFVSEKDDRDHWGKPEVVTGGLNTSYDEGACCFSTDGREMYLTRCATDPTYPRYAQIVKSDRADAAWGKASEVRLTADTLSSFAHPALSPDGEWLYFTSDMPGGKGGLDLWRVRITTAGLGGVENLGEPVNTEGDEEFPTFRPNGDLYFSSNGHGGLGGLDIFIARVGSDGRYHLSHPGYPLNSQGDDFGMTFEGPHNRGFFSSNRGDGRGWDHIYAFENPEIVQTVKGWVYEMEGYELPAAQVYVVGDDGTNEHLSVRSDGSFTKVLQPGVSYLFLASCKGFLNHQEEVRAQLNPKESRDTTLQFALANISAPTLIDNIFYDFDRATLRDSSKTALDKLVVLLRENPHVTIELSAHADYKGSATYNRQLSQRRAEAVVAYLISHGIAADRLTPKGYGKERPKTVKRKLTERYPWLKEGQVLTEEYIRSLKDPGQQEICNQLNRRTEFMVLRTTYNMFDDKGKLKNPPVPKKTQKDLDRDGFDVIFD
jgi:outer membrane protein OmpA-like peptidoglycan-associated protein/tetratricopeptide (TPR) repeat protein